MTENKKAQIGVTGLAVMGANLARNLARNGYTVALHNRSVEKTDALLAEHGADGDFIRTESLQELVDSLESPRRILIMVKAGAPVDAVIEQLTPMLDEGDIIIDGGNSHFPDTIRREHALAEKGLHFVGVGVSGGEEGALWGPSMMPGGSAESYKHLGPLLEKIAAKAPQDGAPCCAWISTDGAGHFKTWNEGDLSSYLIEITAEVLAQVDAKTGKPLVDVIVDAAGQKGTGLWTAKAGLDLGSPVSAIAESVFARALSSSEREQREQAQRELPAGLIATTGIGAGDPEFVEDVRRALLLAPAFKNLMEELVPSWRRVVAKATALGIPVPVFASALSYYDGLRRDRLPASLIQGQRDFFGAHTYGRIDEEGAFHTMWSGDRSEVNAADIHVH